MKPNEFLNPRQLPARANPDSEEAQMLGPLSLRRVKNIHWRHYSEQIRRIYPPLAVNTSIPAEKIKEMGVHIPFTGLEEFDPIKMLNKLASVQSGQGRGTSSPMKVGRRPARWLRRRYQEVLGMTPSVTVDLNLATETLQKGNKETSKDKPQSKSGLREKEATNGLGHIKTKVSIRESSKLALRSPNKCREVTLDELEWIKRGNNRR